MNWLQLLTDFYNRWPSPQPGIARMPKFYAASSRQNLDDAEKALGSALPHSHRALLSQTNGVMDMLAIGGGAWFESMSLFWPIETVVERNLLYRSDWSKGQFRRDFGQLLIFADAGVDGVLFAFPLENGICSPRTVSWDPARYELTELAPTLEEFLRGWLEGILTF